jgi:hypothetical protein
MSDSKREPELMCCLCIVEKKKRYWHYAQRRFNVALWA